MHITRRTALMGATAVAVTAPMPALANPPVNDAGLLGKIQDFRASYAAWRETWNKHLAQRERIRAMPGAPDISDRDYLDFCKAHEQFDFFTPACA